MAHGPRPAHYPLKDHFDEDKNWTNIRQYLGKNWTWTKSELILDISWTKLCRDYHSLGAPKCQHEFVLQPTSNIQLAV